MRNKHHVIYDLDDTLAHFTDGFVHFMQTEILGEEPKPITYPPEYHLMSPFQEKTDLSADQALRLYEKSKTMKFMKPTEIVKLYNTSHRDPAYELTILTARGWMVEPEESVHQWLQHWDLPKPDNIKIVGLRESKAHYVANLEGEVSSVFDDNPHHLKEYMKFNPKRASIFCADRPWNQESPCHVRLNTKLEQEI